MDSFQKIIHEYKNISLDNQQKEGGKVSKKHVINILNYINFQDGVAYINFKHVKYDYIMTLQAKPQPCAEDHVECLWVEPVILKQKLNSYKYTDFVLRDGKDTYSR